jgi:hypothetical protein
MLPSGGGGVNGNGVPFCAVSVNDEKRLASFKTVEDYSHASGLFHGVWTERPIPERNSMALNSWIGTGTSVLSEGHGGKIV